MEYADEKWADPVVGVLNRKTPSLDWSVTHVPKSTWSAKKKIPYRKNGQVVVDDTWVIKCERGVWHMILSLDETMGAVKMKKGGIKPVLTVMEVGEFKTIFKKVMGQPHNKVDALNPRGYSFTTVDLQYSLKPYVEDIAEAIVDSASVLMRTLFSLDGVPMLGEDILSIHPRVDGALYEAVESGDVVLIDNNRSVIEHIGSTKRASAIRVANMYLISSSDFYTLEMSFLDKNPLKPPSKRQYSEKVVSVKDERALDREINTFIRKYSPLFMKASEERFTLIGEDGNILFFRYDFPSVSGRSYQEAHIRVTSKQVSDVETLKDILYHGTILSHAIDAQS
jgi:hypothetical protein